MAGKTATLDASGIEYALRGILDSISAQFTEQLDGYYDQYSLYPDIVSKFISLYEEHAA